MTRLLASVNSLAEAELVYQAGADIIDLKQPSEGALGALSYESVTAISAGLPGNIPLSATIGDLPMHPGLIREAVFRMAATGVDYVKIGFFPGGDWQSVADALSDLTQNRCALIAVLFADAQPDLAFVDILKRAGFAGVMLDTMNKNRGSLMQVMPFGTIERFVVLAKSNSLLCGLAGSLRLEDVSELLCLQPHYLGFRGALCRHQDRTAVLDMEAVTRIKQALAGDVALETF